MEKKSFLQKLKAMGPAAIITSAFIGPGTITTATLAGTNFQYKLIWAVIFSGIALIVLLNMAARLSIFGGVTILEATYSVKPNSKGWKIFIMVFVAATACLTGLGFEAGNIIGASNGLADAIHIPTWVAALIIGIMCEYTVLASSPKALENFAKFFVAAMGIIFIVNAFGARPSFTGVVSGILPTVPEGALVNTMALIGTTLIGLNLVFQSIMCKEKWSKPEDYEDSKFDTLFNVLLGVVMTIAVIVCGGAILYGTGTSISSPVEYSKALEPVLGSWARYIGDFGIFFAGLSSAIATPYSVGLVTAHIFGWDKNGIERKIVGTVITVFGVIMACIGKSPVQIIVFTQAFAACFLPFISFMFLAANNNKKILGDHVNNTVQNVIGVIVCLVTLTMGCWNFYNNVVPKIAALFA